MAYQGGGEDGVVGHQGANRGGGVSCKMQAVVAGGQPQSKNPQIHFAARAAVPHVIAPVFQSDTGSKKVGVVKLTGCAQGQTGCIDVSLPGLWIQPLVFVHDLFSPYMNHSPRRIIPLQNTGATIAGHQCNSRQSMQ